MKRIYRLAGCLCIFFWLVGCTRLEKEESSEKVAFVIVEADEIPKKMEEMIEKAEEEPFRISYEEDGQLYVGCGYGKKEMEGYEIEVDKCQVSEHFLYVHTILTGPDELPKEKKSTCPYVVFRVETSGKQVIFFN